MNEDTRTARPPADPAADPGGRSDGTSTSPSAVADHPALPFDDGADEPIAYRLTARARRAVAPASLPPLAVVSPSRSRPRPIGEDHGEDLEQPGDARPARARALRRAGLSHAEIAAQLDADPLAVDAWIADVRAGGVRRAAPAAPPRSHPSVASTSVRRPALAGVMPRAGGVAAAEVRAHDADQAQASYALARADAARRGRTLIASDPDLAAGVGLLVGSARTDAHAITLTLDAPAVGAFLLGWMDRHLGVARDAVRVVVRPGPAVAGDVARHRWAQQLGVDPATVAHARWRGAPTPDAVEAIVRVADPVAAATVAGWCDALLTPDESELDVAF